MTVQNHLRPIWLCNENELLHSNSVVIWNINGWLTTLVGFDSVYSYWLYLQCYCCCFKILLKRYRATRVNLALFLFLWLGCKCFILELKNLMPCTYQCQICCLFDEIVLCYLTTHMWIKKNGDPDFEVTLGSFDGAELCELVGLHILHIAVNFLDVTLNLISGKYQPYN